MDFVRHKKRQTLQRLATLSLSPLLPLGLATSSVQAAVSTIHAASRLALVIGNSAYPDLPLQNSANDAKAIAADLKRMGFTVDLQMDCKKEAMTGAIQTFSRNLAKQQAVGLFYFAGHGLQMAWRNYLVPVDALLAKSTADQVPQRAVDLGLLLAGLDKAKNPMNIVILDACRDNPFGGEQRSGKGLSQMDAPIGTMLAYATAPGNVASDGEGSNGLYTENLLREMRLPEARIEDVFKRVRLNVRRASQGAQIPWESTSLEDDFYFIPPAQIRELSQQERDRLFAEEAAVWEKARLAAQPALVGDYLRRYPSGRFAELAQLRLDRLLAQKGEKKIVLAKSTGNPFTKGTDFADLDYRVGDRFVYNSRDLLTGIEAARGEHRVTALGDGEVRYHNGAVTDLLGNWLRRPNGLRFSEAQVFVAEYSLGRKWTTRFSLIRQDGLEEAVEVDFKVVGRETVTVPAGNFDAFRVEGRGWNLTKGISLEFLYWAAPSQVRRFVAFETWERRANKILRSERNELIAFSRAE